MPVALRAEGQHASAQFLINVSNVSNMAIRDGDVLASVDLHSGTEVVLEIPLPPNCESTLWLDVHARSESSQAYGSVLWGWGPYSILNPSADFTLPGNETERVTQQQLDTTALSLPAYGENLASNGEFVDGSLSGWKLVSLSETTRVRAKAYGKHTDDWYVILDSDTTRGDRVYKGALCQTLAVKGGKDYVYQVIARATLEDGSKASLVYWDYRFLGSHKSNDGSSVWRTTGWDTYVNIIHVPFYVHSLTLCPALLYGNGAIDIDSVMLSMIQQ